MSGRDEDARRAQEDAEFLSIIESYGDRPAFPDASVPDTSAEEPEPGPLLDEPSEFNPSWNDEDGFVPPPAPPVPRPRGIRAFAWFGIFGVPVLVLLCTVLSISLPSPATLLLLGWFVGGFGYLVATMKGPDDPDSGWDDGAVV